MQPQNVFLQTFIREVKQTMFTPAIVFKTDVAALPVACLIDGLIDYLMLLSQTATYIL